MKKQKTIFFFASIILLLNLISSTVSASEESDNSLPVSFTIGLFSDYMFRGITQTDDSVAIQGSIDYAHDSGFYAGVWASNVEFQGDKDTSYEVDAYIGYGMEAMGIGWDFAALRYMYPDTKVFEDFNEYKVAASISDFTLSLYYSNDMYGSSEDAWYVNGAYSFALPMEISLNIALGYSDYDEAILNNGSSPDDYLDWNIGISKSIKGFDLNLQYVDSNSNSEEMFGKSVTDGRLVFSVSRTF